LLHDQRPHRDGGMIAGFSKVVHDSAALIDANFAGVGAVK
jgi:hypothetical protein